MNQCSTIIEPLERRVLLSQYTLVHSFGGGGVATSHLDNPALEGWEPSLVAQLDDQTILTVGSLRDQDSPTGHRRLVMAQFTDDGQRIQSFGSAGAVVGIELDLIAEAQAQGDGTVLVLGKVDQTSLVARYAPDGTPDTSFSGDGIFELPLQSILSGDEFFTPTAMDLASDGKIVVQGTISSAGAPMELLVARLSSAGVLDSTFDGDGLAVSAGPVGAHYDLDVAPDGKVLVAVGGGSGSSIRRFDPNGSVDTAFGSNGVASFPDFNIVSLDALSDGKILITAGEESIARLNETGQLDGSFGDNGVATMLSGVSVSDGAQFFVGSDAKITVLTPRGTSRFTGDGQLDPSYGMGRQIDPSIVNELGGPYLFELSVAALADNEDIVLTGPGPAGDTPVIRVMYQEDIHLDTLTGRLSIAGTNDADTIVVEAVGDQAQVTRNADIRQFPLAQVQFVDIEAGDGNDSITVSLAIPAGISSGAGHDTILTGDAADTIEAGDGNDSIVTGQGSDLISAGGGSNFINSGDGDNQISTGVGNDTVLSGDGNDSIVTDGGDNAIDAGAGNDYIYGAEGNDSITGGAGDDTLRPGGGDNLTEGGDGDDFIKAVDGRDTIRAGAGSDSIYAGNGDNLVYGGDGEDYIQCGDGADTLWGEIGYDSIKAGLGDDLINGGAGKDHIWGQQGNDRIYGRRNNDAMDGGPGDDRIVGGDGFDKFFGGDGNDVLFAREGDGDADYLDGGPGDDSTRADDPLDQLIGIESILP